MKSETAGPALFQRDPTHDYPVAVRGEGIYIYDDQGRRYLDGTSGAGNVTLGHGRQRIAQVMADQAATLAYCFSAFFTNKLAQDLAERIAAIAPGDLDHVYFVSGGSEGIETAFKLARQYHLLRGNERKQQIIARWRAYHGATLGALGATGMPALRAPFAPWLPDFPHISACYPYRCTFAGCAGQCNLDCANDLEREILQAGPENVAAFVAEPVCMAGIAVGVPPPDYYRRVRQICDKYDVLFIADEVITGFGRTGRYFGIEHWDVVPDMIVFGKGVSSGYCPMGGVIMRRGVRDPFVEKGAFFPHIFTYVNNPLAMRIAGEVLDIIEEEGIIAHVEEVGAYLGERAQDLYKHKMVGEIRNKGMLLGIELVQDRDSKTPFPAAKGVAKRLGAILLERGLSVAATSAIADWVDGDDLRFYPALTITRKQIDEAIGIIDAGLEQLTGEL
jgi:adenosylmethionine-8-amino-7-oxononanoate aminotransferase